jgi:hypothetical protein
VGRVCKVITLCTEEVKKILQESIKKTKVISAKRIWLFPVSIAFLFLSVLLPAYVYGGEPVIIELTQTPCTIVEAEESPQEFVSKNSKDCIRINKETAGKRSFNVLRLKPGKTIFRVTNKNVPYNLGFWVRGKGVGRLTLPSVSGGGLKIGATKDYVVDLKPGEYLYSCPLNPTPDYPLIVED